MSPSFVAGDSSISAAPDVSIIVPLHNDEEWVAEALTSALNQTWASLEVICVDDASTDGTCAVVEKLQQVDSRVRLYQHSTNRTAFQARRLGLEQARGSYVLFLDGDDRLSADAVEVSLDLARANGADLVGFGVDVVSHDGRHPTRFTAGLQPVHISLVADEIVRGLFPIGKVAQGHLWRYLWSIDLLRAAYAALDDDLELPRANDIPVCFLGAVAATHYVSTKKKLYEYYWRRGVSGRSTDTESAFDFYLGAMDSIDAIQSAISGFRARYNDVEDLDAIFDSVRLSMIQVLLRRCEETLDRDLQTVSLRKLIARVGKVDAVRASSEFVPSALPMLAQDEMGSIDVPSRSRRVVMLTTGNLDTGGVQGVLVAQAKLLRDAGFRVIVVVQRLGATASLIPDDVPVLEWTGRNRAEKISDYLRICEEYDVDVIFDHHVLYNEFWPFYALATRARGIPTYGWLHNFALRSLYDSTVRGSFLTQWLPILARVVVLSKVDVAFWKLRGVERVTYLPNPPSPWLVSNGVLRSPRRRVDGVLRLVWWGRLQQHTKRVFDLVDLARELVTRGVDFHLTIIGPDSADATASQLRALVSRHDVDGHVAISGPLHGEDLSDALNEADAYVTVSGIEGYPLTLIEAQAFGMPVVMYELPWLAVLDRNDGVASVPQRDIRALADKIDHIASDPSLYARMSAASLDAATTAIGHDYPGLYEDLLSGNLPSAEYSPSPSQAEMRILLDLAMAFSEEGIQRAKRVERRAQERYDKLRRQLEESRRSVARVAARPPVGGMSREGETGRRIRIFLSLARGRVLGTACVMSARIGRDALYLRVRQPRSGEVKRVQLYREVDGAEITHDLALTSDSDGTIIASGTVADLMKRRWRIRATVLSSRTARVLDLPIHARARQRGFGRVGVRFWPDGTVQAFVRR